MAETSVAGVCIDVTDGPSSASSAPRWQPGQESTASIRAPSPADAEHLAVGDAAVAVLRAVMNSYGIGGDDAIHAIRCLRVALHGFVSLEAAGGFGLPQSVDVSPLLSIHRAAR